MNRFVLVVSPDLEHDARDILRKTLETFGVPFRVWGRKDMAEGVLL